MSDFPNGSSGTRRPSYASVVGGGSGSGSGSGGRGQRQPPRWELPSASPEVRSTTPPSPDLIDLLAQPADDFNPSASSTAIMDSAWDPSSPIPPFHTPTYLRTSRHLSRLRAAHDKQVLEYRELTRSTQLPTSTSSTTLGKLPPPSTHPLLNDVIERLPPPADESLHPLPTRFSPTDKCPGLEILASGSEVRFNGITKTSDEAASVRSDHHIPKEVGIFYFEVTILSRSKDCQLGVGFSSKKANLNRLPGWEAESWAYHGDDGFVFACTASGKAYGPKFGGQDVVGCGIHFGRNEAFFTRNGVFLGTAFTNVKGERLYPSVGMKKPSEHVRVNFGGKPFVFDIDGMVEREREAILQEISKADVGKLHPPDDEDALVKGLVGQYLAHEGYVETARAFNREWNVREASVLPEGERTGRGVEEMEEEDVHAVNRQKIRKSILEGDIDRAMKLQQSYYPRLFDEERMRGVWFRLRCRKFVEMVRRVGENSQTESKRQAEDDIDDVEEEEGDTQMDLDSQLLPQSQQDDDDERDRDNDQDMPDLSTSTASLKSSKNTLMQTTALETSILTYGTSLQSEFGADPDPQTQKTLSDCFAVLAYPSWKESPMRSMFEEAGRGAVAEEVNGAVLRSLGKSSVAAVERLVGQTEALLDEGAGKGGGRGSLVGVGDFLLGR